MELMYFFHNGQNIQIYTNKYKINVKIQLKTGKDSNYLIWVVSLTGSLKFKEYANVKVI